MEISKYWIIGGWENLIINGWVRQNGGVYLKMNGGWLIILSKVILVPQRILNKTSPSFDSMLQKYSASAFQNCHGRTNTSFNKNSLKWINVFMWCIYILSFKLFKNWSSWSKVLLNFFLGFALNYEQLQQFEL